VALSACETGLTDVIRGSAEEYVGLPAGFMVAGVPCVVSSLWAVPDLSTTLLMERFYHHLLVEGMAFAAALRKAQLWVRDLDVKEVANYADRWYQQMQSEARVQLLRYRNYYRQQAEQGPTRKPFVHPYYWAAFTLNGM
jgi:CHAT domain-containing protein